MTHANEALAQRVAKLREIDATFSPAVREALRLAELFDDIKPEAFSLPMSDKLDAFRPLNVNRMLINAHQKLG
jgi:hypothetical protein